MPGRQNPAPLPQLGLILGNPLRYVDAEFGTYTLTGQAAATRLGPRTVIAAQGTYTLTGQAANTKKGRLVGADRGIYTLTGQAATTRRIRAPLICAQGTYTLAGQGAGTNYVAGAARAGAPGPLPSIGLMLTPTPFKRLEADFGTYALAGQVATFGTAVTYSMVAAQGTYTLVGSGALVDREMRADQGTYTLTGQAAILTPNATRVMPANPGTYTLTGRDALLSKTTRINRSMLGNTGTYLLTGQEATLTERAAKRITGEPGTYALVGQDVTTRKTTRNLITATVASYQLRGFDSWLRYSNAFGQTFTDGIEDTLAKDAVNRTVTASAQADGKRYMDASDVVAAPATIALGSASYQAAELASVVVTARRTGSAVGAVAVDWSVTVAEGAPSPAAGTFSWPDGDTQDKSTTLTFGQLSQNRNATFAISNPRSTSGGPTPVLGNPAQATISVFDTAASSTVAYNLNDIDAVVLVPGQTGVTFGASNLEASWNANALPQMVMVPAGGDPRGASAVVQAYTGVPTIGTAVNGSNRMLGYRFTVNRGSIPFGPVDMYLISVDKAKVSTPCRMWLVESSELSTVGTPADVSGITALWPTTMYVKVPQEMRPVTAPSSNLFGWNGAVKSPMWDPAVGTQTMRAFPNETLFWQEVIEAGDADVANVSIELDSFVNAGAGVTIATPGRTAAQANTYFLAGSAVHANVYVMDYVTIRGASNGAVGTGGISSGTSGFNGWNEREGQLMFRRPLGAYDIATGGANELTTPFSSRPFANKNYPYQPRTPEQLPSGNGTFTIPARTSKVVYIDLWVPQFSPGTSTPIPSGTYTSTFRVRVGGTVVKSHPINVVVQRPASNPTFALPATPAVQYWGKFDQNGGTAYGRMYGGLSKQGPSGTNDPNGPAWQTTIANALRLFKRYKIEPGPVAYPAPAGWGDDSYGPANPAQYSGAWYSTANGYAGSNAGQPDKYFISWYSTWRYWSRANGGGGYDMFRGGENGSLTFIDDMTRATQASVRCIGHGMEAGQYFVVTGMAGAWTALNERWFKVVTVVDSNNFICTADTSAIATAYTTDVGAGGAAFRDGPRPSRLWPICDRLATAMAAYPNAVYCVQLADESPASDFPTINAWVATFRDNPGVGKNVKTMLTQPLIRAYRGHQTPSGVVKLEGLHIISISGETVQSGLDVNPNFLLPEWEPALAEFAAKGTEVWRYESGPGDQWETEDLGASHVASTWSLWLEGYTHNMMWEIRGWESYAFNYNFPNIANHNRIFTNAFTFNREDVVSTTMGRWSSNNFHKNGDGSLIFPGRDVIFNEPQAYGLDLIMPKIPMLHLSRGVEETTIFQAAEQLKGRAAVEAIVRRAMPRTAKQIGFYYQYDARRTGHTYVPYCNAMHSTVEAVRDLILS